MNVDRVSLSPLVYNVLDSDARETVAVSRQGRWYNIVGSLYPQVANGSRKYTSMTKHVSDPLRLTMSRGPFLQQPIACDAKAVPKACADSHRAA